MATVNATRSETTYTLELTEEEALYVLDALRKVTPARDQFGADAQDPVFETLSDEFLGHAASYGNHAQLI